MPCVTPNAVAGILERMVLQVRVGETHAASPHEQPLAVGGNEVGEATTEPQVPVEPESAAHRVDHALAPITELLPVEHQRRGVLRRRDLRARRHRRPAHWQVTTPSMVAGAAGAMFPENSAHVSGYDRGCVAMADHPPTVASTIVISTPGELENRSAVVSVE